MFIPDKNKNLGLIFWLLLFPIGLFPQPALNTSVVKNENLKVSAEVKEVELNKNASLEFLEDYDVLDIFLKIKLTNVGDTPILLLTNRLEYQPVHVAQNIDEFETPKGEFSKHYLRKSSEFVDDKMWKVKKKALDTKEPNAKTIFILQPNDFIEYDEGVRLNLPKNGKDRYNPSVWKTHSLEELKNLPTLFIKLSNLSLLGDAISESPAERKRLAFAKKLQKRWSKYGYLWLDDVVSEPIALDLKTALRK